MRSSFRVVIFSGADEDHIQRLIERIHREVPEASVCGVLTERRPGKPRSARAAAFLRNLKDPEFIPYAFSKMCDGVRNRLLTLGEEVLKRIHGGGPAPAHKKSIQCAFHVTTDYHNESALRFVRELNADLGIVYGTRILKSCLFSIPRLGSINIHKRKVPDYRGGGPVGLWELLDDQSEIGVTVHQVTEKLDAGGVVHAATIPIERFDNLTSLALKAHVVANDLLVRSVADFARGTVTLTQQTGSGRMFKAPTPQRLRRLQMQLNAAKVKFKPTGSRPFVKMLAKTMLALPGIAARNRRRRRLARFPVSILFHHLVSDRPHRMGISTEHFLRHVRFLQKYYDVVSLQRAIEMLEANEVKRPTVVLTFDDGYRDNFINLRAVVEETGVPVTMFISSDHVTREAEFVHDIEYEHHGFFPLTWNQVQDMMTSGFEVGSHTRTHFNCGSQDMTELESEIAGSREDLEACLGQRIQSFSFPFGLPENMSPQALEMAGRIYPYILSACGGDNLAPVNGVVRHLRRWCHPNRLWDLELQIQGVLEAPMPIEEARIERITALPEMPAWLAGRTAPPQ